MVLCTAATLLALGGCGADGPTELSRVSDPSSAVVDVAEVADLTVAAVSDSSVTLTWTQVDDGRGRPARYRVRYAPPKIDWQTAELGCDAAGDRIGAPASCTVTGLEPGATYEFLMMSYRLRGVFWQGAVYSNVATVTVAEPGAPAPPANSVQDLTVTASSPTTLTVSWTQVDDGTGAPARYRLKYAAPPIDYGAATVGCNVTGDAIGDDVSCTIEGLAPGTTYDLQLMSYRTVDGVWQDALYSNVVTTSTEALSAPADEPVTRDGIWISREEVLRLPTSGAAWKNVLDAANKSCGRVDLEDQEQSTNVCVLAKALVFARTGTTSYRSDVLTAIQQIVSAPRYGGRALALGRELGAYVVAADLVDLPSHDPALDGLFRTALRTLRTTYTSGAARDLIDCHERRPNNWGAMCGATRIAIARYLGDDADLARAAAVFKGYLGDRSSYAGFVYGDDLSWQCDPKRPVGINPVGCAKSGLNLNGVLPDDQRRGGSFTTSPPKENYVWEALQGLLAQAVMLHRVGYPVWEWEDRALLRAVEWLHQVAKFPAQGDDSWQPHIVNRYYGTDFPAPMPARAGKNFGWTDWTHGS